MAGVAREVAGDLHHFRFIQLPSSGHAGSLRERVNGESVLGAARAWGSRRWPAAALYQARLTRNLPDEIRAQLPASTRMLSAPFNS